MPTLVKETSKGATVQKGQSAEEGKSNLMVTEEGTNVEGRSPAPKEGVPETNEESNILPKSIDDKDEEISLEEKDTEKKKDTDLADPIMGKEKDSVDENIMVAGVNAENQSHSASSPSLQFTDEDKEDDEEEIEDDSINSINPAILDLDEITKDTENESGNDSNLDDKSVKSTASSINSPDTCGYCKEYVPPQGFHPFMINCACCTESSYLHQHCATKVFMECSPPDYKSDIKLSSLFFNSLKFPMYCSKCKQDCFWCKTCHESK